MLNKIKIIFFVCISLCILTSCDEREVARKLAGDAVDYAGEKAKETAIDSYNYMVKKIEEQEQKIRNLNEAKKEQDSKIAEQYDKTLKQGNEIAEQYNKISKQDNKIAEQYNKISKQDNKIAEQYDKISKQDDKIAELEKELEREKFESKLIVFFSNFSNPVIYKKAFLFTFSLFLLPLFLKMLLYYAVAPLVEKSSAIKIGTINKGRSNVKIIGNGEKNLSVKIPSGETFIVVNEEDISGVEENAELRKRTKWLFSWRYWIMSFCNGLRTMTMFTNSSKEDLSLDISSNDPNEYFVEVNLKNSENVLVVPSNIRAYSPSLMLSSTWVFSLSAIVLMRIRYYTCSGTGKLILSSSGGVKEKSLNKKSQRRKASSLILADASLEMIPRKTETLYNYVFSKSDLFDLQLKGDGDFLVSNSISKKGIMNLSSDNILNIIGKLLGF